MTSRLALCAAVLLGLATAAPAAHAAGPWRGQIVDAETGQPLEGVVVVAAWEAILPGLIHERYEFHDVDEVVTDADGRFLLPERSLTPLNPFGRIDGPQLTIFKGGYGRWRYQGDPAEWPKDIILYQRHLAQVRREFATSGAVFELLLVKTREERRAALPARPVNVPYARMPLLNAAINAERVSLGLESLDPGPVRRVP